LVYISDIEVFIMHSLPQTILQRAQALPEGGVVSPKEFLHLGSRAAIDQAFSRLTKEERLLRVARGAYVASVTTRFGARAPAPAKIVASLASLSGDVIAPHGAFSANALGLTQQVPVREVYVTSGRGYKLKLGRFEIPIHHVPRWMLALGTGPAGAAVRALAWLGAAHAREALALLHRTLTPSDWNTLASHCSALPSWMAKAICEEASHA
jgi:hypothetical protein